MTVWAAGEMVHLSDKTPEAQDGRILDERKRVSLFGGANETVSFQVIVDAPQAPAAASEPAFARWPTMNPPPSSSISGLRVVSARLEGPNKAVIGGESIKAFRMLPVSVTEFPAWYLRLIEADAHPASFYDALVPVDAPTGGQPYTLEPGKRMAFWIDVSIPRKTAPGDYQGSITIASDSHADRVIPITLQVYNFVLPDARPFAAVGGYDHQTLYRHLVMRDGKPYEPVKLDRNNPFVKQGLVAMRQMMVMGHEHRLDLFERTMRPMLRRDVSGKVTLDWDDYDNIVLPYLSGSAFDDKIGCPAWPMPYSQDWPEAENYGGIASDAYSSLIADLAAECGKHFRAVNAGDQAFIWPWRRQVCQDGYAAQAAIARLARGADPETPVLSQLPAAPPAESLLKPPANFAQEVSILAPPAQWMDPSVAAKLPRADNPLRGLWLTPGMPPYLPGLSVSSTPADVRALAWFASKYKCTGLFLPEVLNWTPDAFISPAGAETRLFYPGRSAGIDGVLPSVRLKRLRRGLQDAAYLWVLKQRGRGTIADVITDSMVRYAGLDATGDNYQDVRLGGWVADGPTWEMARRLLAEEVQSAVHPDEPANSRLVAQRILWQEFDDKTHAIRVEQIRSFVRPEGEGQLKMTILLDLYNEYSRDAQVDVRIDGLPDGWKASVGEAKLAPMPAASRKTVELTAVGSHVPAAGTGKMTVPISITSDLKRRQELTAGVGFLVAGRVKTPPKIDGELDDWVMRSGNTAGDFRPVGRRGMGDGQARRGTLAFVNHDDENLYIAFRCEEPNTAGMSAKANNIFHYEQLMACGEDLVEILLDPGAAGKGPEDLYHVAVKSGGVVLTEKGVRMDPPLGKAQPWPVAASVATKVGKDYWVVEAAIPLSALGPAGKSKFWGVNFTRFATQGSESSSWSGAPRYYYDPRNLDTMFIAAGEATTTPEK